MYTSILREHHVVLWVKFNNNYKNNTPYIIVSWYPENIGGNNEKILKLNQPPKKNRMKCITDIIKCKYSAKKNISNIGPLYSVE